MDQVDKHEGDDQYDEDDLFLNEVVRDEYELLFLDSYLKEMFGNSSMI